MNTVASLQLLGMLVVAFDCCGTQQSSLPLSTLPLPLPITATTTSTIVTASTMSSMSVPLIATQEGTQTFAKELCSVVRAYTDDPIKNEKQMVRILTSSGTSSASWSDPAINFTDSFGWTALMEASAKGHAAIVDLLLTHKAQVDLQNREGWTALLQASHTGNTAITESLLSKKADINHMEKGGLTALLVATMESGRIMVSSLDKIHENRPYLRYHIRHGAKTARAGRANPSLIFKNIDQSSC